MDNRKKTGKIGEEAAAEFLKRLGYNILGINVTNKIGEIDLVAQDGETLVLVEVKTRRSLYSRPAEAVDYKKQDKLRRVGALFLAENFENMPLARFDVIEVIYPHPGRFEINHIIDAFE